MSFTNDCDQMRFLGKVLLFKYPVNCLKSFINVALAQCYDP